MADQGSQCIVQPGLPEAPGPLPKPRWFSGEPVRPQALSSQPLCPMSQSWLLTLYLLGQASKKMWTISALRGHCVQFPIPGLMYIHIGQLHRLTYS